MSADTEKGSLYKKARDVTKGKTLGELHDKTGLSLSWLRKFKAGEIQDPSVNKIETLLSAYGSL